MKSLKSNPKFLILIIAMTLFQNCQSQTKKNPKYLGSKYGSFDLGEVTFNEKIDTLFSKVKNEYYKNQIKENGQLVGSQVFYDIEANKATNIFFIDENYKATKPIFIVDKNNIFFMISSSFKTDFPPVKIFERINNKFKKYNVKLKSTDKTNQIYQWETPEKIIVFKYLEKGASYYLSYLTILDKQYSIKNLDFPFNKFSNSAPLCLDNSCKK